MTDQPTTPTTTWYGTTPLEVTVTEATVTIVDADGLEVAHWQRDKIVADPDVAFAVTTAVNRAHTDPVGLLEQHQSHLAALHS